MGERIRDFSVRHTILFCIAVEIAGLAALIIFGGIIVLALPEADYYIPVSYTHLTLPTIRLV